MYPTHRPKPVFNAILTIVTACLTLGQGADQAATETWVDAWGRSPLSTTVTTSSTTVQATSPATFNNQTYRLMVYPTLGGSKVRVKFTNKFSKTPLVIGGAHVALRQSAGTIQAGTDRALTFGGASSVDARRRGRGLSDPATLAVVQHHDIAISVYLPGKFTPSTFHPTGLKTQLPVETREISPPPPQCQPLFWPNPTTTTMVFFVSDVQVLRRTIQG